MTEDGNPIFLTFRLAMSLGIIPFCNTISGIVAIYTNRCMNSLLSGKIKQDEKVERNEKDEVLMIGVEVPVTTLPFSPDVNVPFSATSNAPLVNVVESPSTPAAPLAEIEDSSEDADEEVPQFRNLNDGDPENRRPTHQKTDSEFTIRPVSHRPPPITNRVAIPYPQEIPEEAFMAQGSFVYGGVMSGGADKPGDMGVLQEISDISHSISGKLGKGLTESDTSISISKGVANAGQNNVQSVSPKDSVKSNKTIEKKHIEPGFESDPVENISAKSSKGDLAEESASPPNPGIAPSESSKDLPFKSSSKPDLNESSPIAITTMVPSESTKSLVKSSSKPNIAPAPELNLKNSSVIVIKPEANDIFTGIVPSTSTKSLTRPASKPDIIQAPLLESENGNTASSKLQNLKDVLEVPPPPALDYNSTNCSQTNTHQTNFPRFTLPRRRSRVDDSQTNTPQANPPRLTFPGRGTRVDDSQANTHQTNFPRLTLPRRRSRIGCQKDSQENRNLKNPRSTTRFGTTRNFEENFDCKSSAAPNNCCWDRAKCTNLGSK